MTLTQIRQTTEFSRYMVVKGILSLEVQEKSLVLVTEKLATGSEELFPYFIILCYNKRLSRTVDNWTSLPPKLPYYI